MTRSAKVLEALHDILFQIQEMTNLRPEESGVPLVIWVSQRGRVRHGPRIKISPSGSKAPKDDSVAMKINPAQMEIVGDHRKYDPSHLRLAHEFIKANHTHLMDLWREKIDFTDFKDRMQKVGGVSVQPKMEAVQ